MCWGYQDILGPKDHTRKIDNIRNDFEVYQLFMHNFLYQTIPIFPLYLLPTKTIETFWSEGIHTFWSRSIRTVWQRKSEQLVTNCSETQTTYYLIDPFFSHLFVSDLTHTNCSNSVFQSSLK